MSCVTNYDVIFFSCDSSKQIPTNCRQHVGNARFLVIVQMHSNSFLKAIRKGNIDTCRSIVDKIVDTICNKTRPQGRFLTCTGYELKDLGNGKKVRDIIFQRICQILKKHLSPIEKARLGRALKSAAQRQKPINLNDHRFIIGGESSNESSREKENENNVEALPSKITQTSKLPQNFLTMNDHLLKIKQSFSHNVPMSALNARGLETARQM